MGFFNQNRFAPNAGAEKKETHMQYLNDQHGNAVGVFISLPEWEAIQRQLENAPEREAWLVKCVNRGMAEMEAGHFASDERITGIFDRMGAHAD